MDLYHRPPPIEKLFTTVGSDAKQPLDVYFEVLGMDPMRQAIQARLEFATKAEPEGVDFGQPPGANIVVYASDGYDIQNVELQRSGRPISRKASDPLL